MRFRKKSIVIEAYQWSNLIGWGEIEAGSSVLWGDEKCIECDLQMKRHGRIKTPEGYRIVCPGDWIITGIKGEKYPCKPGIFEDTYEKVE